MIETVMLVALGFAAAMLLALLAAPAVWNRAVRLTTRKIEATMPISVADINADKDLLRAEYAVEMRRLELALDQARQRAARHLMERNRNMVDMDKLESEIAALKGAVAERTKAAQVLEQTVKKRVPELEEQLAHMHKVIAARELELSERASAFENQTESLELAQSIIRRQEQEIDKLREALEGGGLLRAGRWGAGLSEEKEREAMAKENGKLHAELSRLREQFASLRDGDIADAMKLRAEMQHLASLMLSGAKLDKSRSEASTGAKGQARKSDAADKPGGARAAAPEDAPKGKRAPKQKAPAKPRRSLSERLAGLKRKKVKEDA